MPETINQSASPGYRERWKPPFMAWFEGDFAGSFNVRKMPPIARLMYRSLLQQAWHTDNPPYLPSDDTLLRLMADAPSKMIWAKNRDIILARFHKTYDGKWLFHPKSVREYDRVLAEHERKVQAGEQRWRAMQEQSSSAAPEEHEQADTAPLSPHIYIQNQPTTTTRSRSISTETAKATPDRSSLGKDDLSHARDSMQAAPADLGQTLEGSDRLIEEICRVHPRLQKETVTHQSIVSAAFDEMRQNPGWTALQGLQFLLERTRLYREKTDLWPDDQRRYVLSSPEFFRTGEYKTDSKFWEKNDERGTSKAEQQQRANLAARDAARQKIMDS